MVHYDHAKNVQSSVSALDFILNYGINKYFSCSYAIGQTHNKYFSCSYANGQIHNEDIGTTM